MSERRQEPEWRERMERRSGDGQEPEWRERMERRSGRNQVAVALHYNGNGAPRVVAKGGGHLADRIIETAREHNVPLQEDAALAATLSRIDLGREIPRELFVAVAHVLAFAWAISEERRR
jgi:flagellar biosynthesis protein